MSFSFNADSCRFPSSRRVVFAGRGAVCCTQPLAAQAGLEIMRRGGNAIDAAIAAAACMTVLEPCSNGIGGDAFAIVSAGGKLYGLNSSGPAPKLANADALRGSGAIPKLGWYSVTVPGAPAAWAALSSRFGKLTLGELLNPAITYAAEGFPVATLSAHFWDRAFHNYYPRRNEEAFSPWFDTFAPQGRAPMAGEIMRLPDHARTLNELAQTECESFYRGRLAGVIDEWSRKTGGWLRRGDLESYAPEWVTPLSVNYRGYTVHELPPNGQGIVALMALGILDGLKLPERGEAAYHLQLEAMKLAFADGLRNIAEPRAMKVSPQELLAPERLARRRELIGESARLPEPGGPDRGGTIYLCTADGEGNMVSYIQSNYLGFGSGLVVPGTGIALHSRGLGFSLDAESANVLAPGKRPYHTIIPGFLSREGRHLGPFGVMGAYMQPQGHVQVISNLLDFGMNPQEALDAPRWQWMERNKILLEPGFTEAEVNALSARGHEIGRGDPKEFGRGQIILRDENGTLCAATEPRADGSIAAM